MSTHNISFRYKIKKITLHYPESAAMGIKIVFETAVVNEPAVLESLKFYCTYIMKFSRLKNKVVVVRS